MGLREAIKLLKEHEKFLIQNNYEEIMKKITDEKTLEKFLKYFIEELKQTIEILENSKKFEKIRNLDKCKTIMEKVLFNLKT